MKSDVSKAGNDCIASKRNLKCIVGQFHHVRQVGDVWGWSVGTKVKASGFYYNRFLYTPKRLQMKPSRQLLFQSKPSLLRYLQSAFPEADINAFFASFTWDIPAEAQSSKKGKCGPNPKSLLSEKEAGKMVRSNGVFERTRKATLKKSSWTSSKRCGTEPVLGMSSVGEQTFASGPTTKIFR